MAIDWADILSTLLYQNIVILSLISHMRLVAILLLIAAVGTVVR